ncbi:hypothetical protein H7965_30260, partial [Siccirubricoccus deserti]|nr:hypothetical protein [Siccirubricoccus deserti]
MWPPGDGALVGDFGVGQALSDDQYCLLAAFIPPVLFYLVRTGCQWRHLQP